MRYISPWVPPEWIAAHGLRPVRWVPGATAARRLTSGPMGVCPFALAVAASAAEAPGRAVVVAARCDQLRRTADAIGPDDSVSVDARGRASLLPAVGGALGEVVLPDVPREVPAVFLLAVPATAGNPNAEDCYRLELERLGRFLVRRGGRPPAAGALRREMQRYAEARLELRARRGEFGARAFAEAVIRVESDGTLPPKQEGRPSPAGRAGIPVALVGGPLRRTHLELLDRIESRGGRMVLDATENGERGLPPPSEAERAQRDPLGALAHAFLEGIPDVAQRPNTGFHAWLAGRVRERGARGVIAWHYPWCDVWQAEVARLQETLGVPVLDLDAGDSEGLTPQVDTRLQALLEMLT